jgi:sulfide:quinone oxidoreductase
MLMPNAGQAGSDWMAGQLAAHDITSHVGAKAEHIEAGRVDFSDGGEQPFDLLVAVPPHRAPDVVAQSGLAAKHGWMAVDAGTLRTSYEGVYAVGDVTLIPLANGLPFPKAGVMAELQGLSVARAIAAEVSGREPAPPFDGRAFCPIELGTQSAARVDGDWYATPEPIVTIAGPSPAHAAEKGEFEREHLERWFGDQIAQE